MRRFGLGAALALGALSAVNAAPADAAETNPLELRRVLLSTGGVGYFEHEATVTGDATLSLDVGLDQVSDVLKSIVVLDEKGRVGQATLPGREPLTEAFRDLPFSLTDLSSPASLLAALRGSSVRVSVHGDTFEGRIVSVVEENVSLGDNRGTVLRHLLTLMGAVGLKQVLIADADGIEIGD